MSMDKVTQSSDDSAKWEAIWETTLRRMSLGFLAGATPALLFMRRPAPRAAMCAFGVGIGVGMSYVDSKYIFQYNVIADRFLNAVVTEKPSE